MRCDHVPFELNVAFISNATASYCDDDIWTDNDSLALHAGEPMLLHVQIKRSRLQNRFLSQELQLCMAPGL